MKDQTIIDETVHVMEAAKELGTTHLRVLMLIKEGKLKGNREEGEWLVTRESLECFRRHGGELRMQAKCHTSCGRGSCGGH